MCRFSDLMNEPRRIITEEELRKLPLDENWTQWQLANHYGVSDRTIRRHLKKYGIALRELRYSHLTDDDVKAMLIRFKEEGHEYGEISMDTLLKEEAGITIQRARLRRLLTALTPATAPKRFIPRRIYIVRYPLSVVHLDGYHKLVRWRIVVHGAIDGFSRLLYFFNVTDNNRASTVLRHFKGAVYQYGLPVRVRIDKGKENLGVVYYMLYHRGTKSVSAGRSVHNTRIERMWVDVRKRCTEVFRRRFMMLEEQGYLHHKSDLDLYCLHLCFLPLLEKAVSRFKTIWNAHKHRSLRNKAPKWVFFQSLMQLKAYALKNNCSYKELDQEDWRALDDQAEELGDQLWATEQGIIVPRIVCPLEEADDTAIRSAVQQMRITWRNSVEKYIELRVLVKTIAGQSSSGEDE